MANAPNVENYMLGKGVLYLDRLDSSGNHTGELDLGNAPAFNVSLTTEDLPHRESRSGIKEEDHNVETSLSASVSFTLDEPNTDNLALAFRASEPSTTSQGSGSVAAESATAKLDKWIALDYRNISNVVIGAYTEDTDYEVDFATGRIKCLSTGSITADEALTVAYDYSSETWNIVNGVSNSGAIMAYLRFVGDPEQGTKYEMEIWRVKLKLSGDVPFISDDWATITFEGKILKDNANHSSYPWFRLREEGTSGGGS